MDTFSHALWGYGLFGYKRYPWTAIFFGAMPDLISFGLLLLINFFLVIGIQVNHHSNLFPHGYFYLTRSDIALL